MEHLKWLEERRKGIGGSDAPVVCGLSPWKSPYQLYLEKRGEANGQMEDNDVMFWGRTLEPVIRQRYADVTGIEVAVPDGIMQSPQYDWMLGNLDGIGMVEGEPDRIVECKTARMPIGWGEPGTAEVPDYYAIQVQHYMVVSGLLIADIPVLIGGSDFRIYTVEADRELQEMLTEREAAFWQQVQEGRPPEVTSYADIKQRFGAISKAVRVEATPEVLEAIVRLKALKPLLAEEEMLKARIMGHMGEADTLVTGEIIVATWKLDKPTKKFNAKAFQETHPDLYEEFKKRAAPTRRFLVK